jgi:hypothetical protein
MKFMERELSQKGLLRKCSLLSWSYLYRSLFPRKSIREQGQNNTVVQERKRQFEQISKNGRAIIDSTGAFRGALKRICRTRKEKPGTGIAVPGFSVSEALTAAATANSYRTPAHSELLCVTAGLNRCWYSAEVMNEHTIPR